MAVGAGGGLSRNGRAAVAVADPSHGVRFLDFVLLGSTTQSFRSLLHFDQGNLHRRTRGGVQDCPRKVLREDCRPTST